MAVNMPRKQQRSSDLNTRWQHTNAGDACMQDVLTNDAAVDFATSTGNPHAGAAARMTLIMDIQRKENLEMVSSFIADQLEASRRFELMLRTSSAGADIATSMRTEALIQKSSDAARRLEAMSRFIRVRDRIPEQMERGGQHVRRSRLAAAADPTSGTLLALALYELRSGQQDKAEDHPSWHVFLNEIVSMHQLRPPDSDTRQWRGAGASLIAALQQHVASTRAVVLKPLEDAPGLMRYYGKLGFVPHDMDTAALTGISVGPYGRGVLIRFSHMHTSTASMKRVASRDMIGG